MQTDRGWLLGGVALVLVGCRAADPWAELPKPDQLGDRVAVATDAAERVCAGTLATIDAEVERIESELDLDSSADRYRIWILQPERASEICGGETSCNDLEHGAVISADNFEVERRTALELTPLLLARAGVETHPFFVEGIARAMSWPSCPYLVVPPLMFRSWIHYVEQIPDAQLIAGE